MEIPQKITNRIIILSSNFTIGYIAKANKNQYLEEISTFFCLLNIIHNRMEYYLALDRILSFVPTQMNLKNTMLSQGIEKLILHELTYM